MNHHQEDLTMFEVADFDPDSGNLVERALFNHRRLVLAFCLIVTLFLGFQAVHLRQGASFEKMIPTGHPYIANFIAHRSDLSGLGNSLRIAVEAREGTLLDAEYLETLRKINDEVFLLPGVERPFMKSLWTPATRWLAVTEDGLDGGPVISESYDGSPAELAQLRENIERSGELGQLVAADYRSSIIFVPLLETTESGTRLDYGDLSTRIEKIRAKYESSRIAIHVTGFAKIVGDLMDGLLQMLAYFGVAIVVCSVALYWYTRCVRSTLLVVSCSMVAVLWLLGLLPLLHMELDPYSVLVPFLVFAIGMSHGAQKMNGIMQDIGRGADKWVAARFTFRRLFLAGLTALLADAVGFAVLMIIDIQVIKDLAIAASLGVAMLIVTNLILLPILLSYTGVSAKAAARTLKSDGGGIENADRHPAWVFLDRFTQRRWASIAVIGAVALGIAGFAVSLNLKVGDLDPGAPEFRQESRYNRDSAYLTAHYSTGSDTFVAMVTTPQFQCASYDALILVDALEWRLRQLPGVTSTQSLAAMSKATSVGMNEGSLLWYEIPRSQDMLNAIVSRAPRELFNQNCDLLSVYVNLRDHKAQTLDDVVRTIEAFAQEHNSDQARFILAAGNAGIEAATNIVVKKSNTQMLLLVYAAVIVLCFITFRSWRAVVCATLPLLLTSVLCEALMVALGIGVKVATLPVIALGVGIGVDYALYILSVTLTHLRNGESLSNAYYGALLFTGRVVILTGFTLGAAVATWAFSPIKFQADMGILLAFMFVWNMLGALLLLPALGSLLLPNAVPQAK